MRRAAHGVLATLLALVLAAAAFCAVATATDEEARWVAVRPEWDALGVGPGERSLLIAYGHGAYGVAGCERYRDVRVHVREAARDVVLSLSAEELVLPPVHAVPPRSTARRARAASAATCAPASWTRPPPLSVPLAHALAGRAVRGREPGFANQPAELFQLPAVGYDLFELPSMIGFDEADAEHALGMLGLTVKAKKARRGDRGLTRVTAQSPRAGAVVWAWLPDRPGAVVRLTLGRAGG